MKIKNNKINEKINKVKRIKIDVSNNEAEKNIVKSSLTTKKYEEHQRNKKNT